VKKLASFGRWQIVFVLFKCYGLLESKFLEIKTRFLYSQLKVSIISGWGHTPWVGVGEGGGSLGVSYPFYGMWARGDSCKSKLRTLAAQFPYK
jgi:hypothetical protein